MPFKVRFKLSYRELRFAFVIREPTCAQSIIEVIGIIKFNISK